MACGKHLWLCSRHERAQRPRQFPSRQGGAAAVSLASDRRCAGRRLQGAGHGDQARRRRGARDGRQLDRRADRTRCSGRARRVHADVLGDDRLRVGSSEPQADRQARRSAGRVRPRVRPRRFRAHRGRERGLQDHRAAARLAAQAVEVKDDSPSRTAAWVAAARQLAQLLPPEAQLVSDPYGAAFSYPRLRARIERLKPMAEMRVMKQWILYMQVRTRVIDDALRAWVAGGGRQVVLLGAGYDTRALRLPELADVDVFEVDHPATQHHKQGVLAQLAVESPSRYVTWDFETRAMDALPDVIEEAGLVRTKPVFTIWDGVTMYLTDAAIDASLRAIRAWSPPSSRLAMTYFAKSRIEQPSLATRSATAILATFGEPWRFGSAPDQLPAYLEARGFRH